MSGGRFYPDYGLRGLTPRNGPFRPTLQSWRSLPRRMALSTPETTGVTGHVTVIWHPVARVDAPVARHHSAHVSDHVAPLVGSIPR